MKSTDFVLFWRALPGLPLGDVWALWLRVRRITNNFAEAHGLVAPTRTNLLAGGSGRLTADAYPETTQA